MDGDPAIDPRPRRRPPRARRSGSRYHSRGTRGRLRTAHGDGALASGGTRTSGKLGCVRTRKPLGAYLAPGRVPVYSGTKSKIDTAPSLPPTARRQPSLAMARL